MKQRRFWSGFLAVALLCAAAGGASAETLKVQVVGIGAQGQAYLQNNIIPAFEKAHPGVKVEVVTLNWDQRFDRITADYAAGQLADVLQIGSEDTGALAPQGIIQPIDSFVKGWKDLSDFPKVEQIDGTWNGHLYTVPYELDMRTLIYRGDLFAKAGLDSKAPPADWDQLAQFAKKLTVKSDAGKFQQSGMVINNNPQTYDNFLFEAGGHFFSEDLKHVTIGDAAGLQAAQFMSDLVNQWGVSPPGGYGSIGSGAAMAFSGNWEINNPDPSIEVDVALPPKGPTLQTSSVHINKWVIGSQTKDPQLAWDWIRSISEPDTMAALEKVRNSLPPRLSMLHYSPWADDPRWRTFFGAVAIATPYRAFTPTFNTLLWNAGYLQDAMAAILANKKTPAQALGELQQKGQADLDEYWAKQAK